MTQVIKNFIDKVSSTEAKKSVAFQMPLIEAKQLRDEIIKLLLDQRDQKDEPIQVVFKGERW
jgi:hypothetical protein